MKKRSIIRIAVNILSFGMLFFYFVYMLRVYGDFPEEIGIHFGEDNEFDVYYSKWLAFFPFMAGFGLAIVFTVGEIAVSRAKCISKKLSEDDDIFVRKVLLAALGSMKLFWAEFYSIWAHCVIHQTRMFTFGIPVRAFQGLPLFIIPWAFIAIDSKVRLKKSKRYIIIGEIILTVFMIIGIIIGTKLRK
ncbi:MAG: hypothetical protein WBK46_12465 [Ruminococcus flavefaciens]